MEVSRLWCYLIKPQSFPNLATLYLRRNLNLHKVVVSVPKSTITGFHAFSSIADGVIMKVALRVSIIFRGQSN